MIPEDCNFTEIFSRYPREFRPSRPPIFLGNAGGLSGARYWTYDCAFGRLALKAWPIDGPDRSRLQRIHAEIAKAKTLAFVPTLLPDHNARTFQESFGFLWEIMPWLPGKADRGRPPTLVHIRAGFAASAALHRTWGAESQSGRSPGLIRRLEEIQTWVSRDFTLLEDSLNGAADSVQKTLARRWLELSRPAARVIEGEVRAGLKFETRLQTCLRDLRGDHLLFDGDRLSGLVDFGALDLDVVSTDLARLLEDWIGEDRAARAEALASYTGVRPLSIAETKLIDAFEHSSALLIGGHWARRRFVENRAFEDPAAVARGLERGIDRLARWIASHGRMG